MKLALKTAVFFSLVVIANSSYAVEITDPAFFNSGDVTIDFEMFPSEMTTVPDGTALTNQYAGLGVLFSSEDAPNVLQNTDKDDTDSRFDSPFRILATVAGGGVPTSGTRYASGDLFINERGANVSDMRIDFINPVTAFGMYIIDNDFSTARLQAFDMNSNLVDSVVIPQVNEGGLTYSGLDVSGTGNSISYFILDGNNDLVLDSTFIDDLSFRPIPLPAAAWLFVSGILGLIFKSRIRK